MLSRVCGAAALLVVLTSCTPGLPRIGLSRKGVAFSVEVARSEAEHERGLMFRKTISKREGMLFVFDADQHLAFWMKDTPVSLSIGFISADGRILEIEDMQPFSLATIRSRSSCRYALELAQGTFRDIGAAEGDSVVFPSGFK